MHIVTTFILTKKDDSQSPNESVSFLDGILGIIGPNVLIERDFHGLRTSFPN